MGLAILWNRKWAQSDNVRVAPGRQSKRSDSVAHLSENGFWRCMETRRSESLLRRPLAFSLCTFLFRACPAKTRT